ncbi:MAG: hypothetical protein H0W83_12900, partial [Planctomycetes bacterium]|nr:hypothetical protein [Planctomycetota bacterium]
GVPVAFTVHLERAYVHEMRNRQFRPSVGAGAAFGSNGTSSYGTGVGLGFSSTQVYLLGGDGVAESQVFRRELRWGDNSFSVPLTPARVLHLTVQVEGGREGWESIGNITIPTAIAPQVRIVLDHAGGAVTVGPAQDRTPAPAAAPVAPTQPPPAEEHGAADKPAESGTPPVQVQLAPPPQAVAPAAPYPDPALDH